MSDVKMTYRSFLEKKCSGTFFTVLLYLLLFSYFYNLPVVSYSVKGTNELRLYDLLGILLFIKFFANFGLVIQQIKTIVFYKRFYEFMLYCTISILLTLFFAIINNRILVFAQAILYLYHMWVFFLGSFFLFYNLNTRKKYVRFVKFLILCIAIEMVLIILQNLGVVPFLWGQEYYLSYDGFMSGTLGPNKIVLGMFALISLGLIIAFLFYKEKLVPKLWVYSALGVIGIALLLSGSRTTYVGVLVFMGYFLFKSTARFFRFAILGGVFFAVIVVSSPQIVEKIGDVLEERVTYVIDGPEDVKDYEDFSGVYSELSTGRDKLHLMYVFHLIDNPGVIPLGQGFVNRMGVGASAHNIYLSLINEVGIVGLFLYLRWLFSYLIIKKRRIPSFQLALNGLVLGMLVTLFLENIYTSIGLYLLF
ncbi:hypothetical protein SCB49_01587 [unidentified eubacterium SCB49]|nr:hypothetical protein SCB49_01587 [unidentified eubacterium SCB49]